MATKTKATYRNARAGAKGVFSANHNTLEAMRKEQKHIIAADCYRNAYYSFDLNGQAHNMPGGFDSREHELQLYASLYGDGIKAQNERHKASRHHERVRSVEDIYLNKKTAPMETILQIGSSKDTTLSREDRAKALWKAATALVKDMRKQYGQNLVLCDMSLHMEEISPHIHLRYTFRARDRYGFFMPLQTQALRELGFSDPDPTKKTGRYNNPLISFTDTIRERFYGLCERQGLVIDREVENPSQRHQDRTESRVRHLEQLYNALMTELFPDMEQALKNDFIDTYTVNSSKGYKKPIKDFYKDYVSQRMEALEKGFPELEEAIRDFQSFMDSPDLEDPNAPSLV